MIGDISRAEHIYIVCGYTDMRKSIDGLAAIIQKNFRLDVFSGSLFLFCGKRCDRIKALLWEEDGFVLLYKRLENGKYKWPRDSDEARQITQQEIADVLIGNADSDTIADDLVDKFDESGKIGVDEWSAEQVAFRGDSIDNPIENDLKFLTKRPKRLKPDIWYKTSDFDYLYHTNKDGWIDEVSVDKLYLNLDERPSHYSNPPGKLPGDEAGHLIADIFGGSRDADNIVAMSFQVNRSEFKILENSWKKSLENGQEVSVYIKIDYGSINTTGRPVAFDITYYIDGESYNVLIDN